MKPKRAAWHASGITAIRPGLMHLRRERGAIRITRSRLIYAAHRETMMEGASGLHSELIQQETIIS